MAGSFDPLVGGFIGHDETTGALANSPSMSTKHGVKYVEISVKGSKQG